MRQQAHDKQRNNARTARSFWRQRPPAAQAAILPRSFLLRLLAVVARPWSSWFSSRTAGSRFPPWSALRPPPYAVSSDPERLSRVRAQRLGKDWHGPECGVIGVRVPRRDVAKGLQVSPNSSSALWAMASGMIRPPDLANSGTRCRRPTSGARSLRAASTPQSRRA